MFRVADRTPGPNERAVQTSVVEALMDMVASGAVSPERFPRLNLATWPTYHGLASLVADRQIPRADRSAALGAVTTTVMAGAGVSESLLRAAGVPIDVEGDGGPVGIAVRGTSPRTAGLRAGQARRADPAASIRV